MQALRWMESCCGGVMQRPLPLFPRQLFRAQGSDFSPLLAQGRPRGGAEGESGGG